ncbi:MAG: hypothetical protein ACOH2H_21810, partial [Cypionkella sp.]
RHDTPPPQIPSPKIKHSSNKQELQLKQSGPEWGSQTASGLPFGRLVDPQEAAHGVNFLVSDDAGLMTGAIVSFDPSVWCGRGRNASAGWANAPLVSTGTCTHIYFLQYHRIFG